MFKLIKNGEVYAPEYLGKQDILVVHEKIALIGATIKNLPKLFKCQEYDASDKLVLPGFIDQHVHITGGGGEGGPATRTPEIKLTSLTGAGITTVVGLLGVDGVTRSLEQLLAKARGLEAEGISTYIFSGSYELPSKTISGTIKSDLVLFDKVVGVGEIAISDHRSSQPTLEMLTSLASEARVGGLLGGKAGIIHLHLGEGREKLHLLFEIVNNTDIPAAQFVPTHVNRLEELLADALKFLKLGGNLDLTAGISRKNASPHSMEVHEALKYIIENNGDLSRVTISSDGNGSMPVFSSTGKLVGLEIGSVKLLWEDVRTAVLEEVIPLSQALALITSNVAKLLMLPNKGTIAIGNDADLVVVSKKELQILQVYALGKLMVSNGKPVVKGSFE